MKGQDVRYTGEALDPRGASFLCITGEHDLNLVSVEVARDRVIIDLAFSPAEAREFARHLIEAANAAS